MSEETNVKIGLAIVGMIGSLVGAFTAAIVFFWQESRNRYLDQLGGLRTLLIVTEFMTTELRLNPGHRPELQSHWFVDHSASILHKEHWFALAQELIRLTVKAQSSVDEADGNLSEVIQDLEGLKARIEGSVRKHLHSLKRLVLLA